VIERVDEGVDRGRGLRVWAEGMGRGCGLRVWAEGVDRGRGLRVWAEGVGRGCGQMVWAEGVTAGGRTCMSPSGRISSEASASLAPISARRCSSILLTCAWVYV
jgi:hypothetical protein